MKTTLRNAKRLLKVSTDLGISQEELRTYAISMQKAMPSLTDFKAIEMVRQNLTGDTDTFNLPPDLED